VNVSILSNLSLVIPCVVNAAPFPDVTWLKDGGEVNLTARVSIQRYDASLRFENQTVEDSGSYQCILTNSEGDASSDVADIVVLGKEWSCPSWFGSRSAALRYVTVKLSYPPPMLHEIAHS